MITWHVGDKVICRNSNHIYLKKDRVYTIQEIIPCRCDDNDSVFDSYVIVLKEIPQHPAGFWVWRFEHIPSIQSLILSGDVYR